LSELRQQQTVSSPALKDGIFQKMNNYHCSLLDALLVAMA
jgi:hypothetical protein